MSCKPLASLIATVLAASLQSAGNLAHADETVLSEIIVTASLDRALLDIAQPTSVLSGDELTRQRSRTLGETLSRQLGVSSSYFGPASSRPVIRGLSGYRLLTLQDGLATLDVGSLSDDHAVSIDPSLAEQIEVLKGPGTLLYGSGAAGGLINVVTPRLPSRREESATGFAEIRGGSAADEHAGVASITFAGRSGAVHVDAFKSKSDAIDIPGATISQSRADYLSSLGIDVESHEGSVPNAFSDTQGGALGLAWWNEQISFAANVSRYENEYGIPSEETAYIDMRQDRYEGKVEWQSTSGWLRRLQLQGAFNDYGHTEFEAPSEPGTVFTQDAYEMRLSLDHAHADNTRGTIGVQLTRLDFVAEGDEAFVPASKTKNLGIFALEEFLLDRWTFSLGGRYEQQDVEVDPSIGPGFDDAAFSAAASAILKLNETDTLSLSATRSARHPQATELYADGPHVAAQRYEIGDGDLDTEVAQTVDVTLRRNNDGISWLIGVFHNDYDNFIFAAPTGTLVDDFVEVEYTQAPAKLYGYEAEVWVPLGSTDGASWRMRLMTDYTRGELDTGGPLPAMPPRRIGAGVHLDKGEWHAQIEGIHHDKQTRLAPNELPTDSFVMLNADVSFEIPRQRGEWFFFVRGTNLLDEEARQHTSALKDLVPLPGRSFSAGARVSF